MEASEDHWVRKRVGIWLTWRKAQRSCFHLRVIDSYPERCHTKIKLLKECGSSHRNVDDSQRWILLGFLEFSLPPITSHVWEWSLRWLDSWYDSAHP
jgi:hypothetical protein